MGHIPGEGHGVLSAGPSPRAAEALPVRNLWLKCTKSFQRKDLSGDSKGTAGSQMVFQVSHHFLSSSVKRADRETSARSSRRKLGKGESSFFQAKMSAITSEEECEGSRQWPGWLRAVHPSASKGLGCRARVAQGKDKKPLNKEVDLGAEAGRGSVGREAKGQALGQGLLTASRAGVWYPVGFVDRCVPGAQAGDRASGGD